jgi:hypothetical protein
LRVMGPSGVWSGCSGGGAVLRMLAVWNNGGKVEVRKGTAAWPSKWSCLRKPLQIGFSLARLYSWYLPYGPFLRCINRVHYLANEAYQLITDMRFLHNSPWLHIFSVHLDGRSSRSLCFIACANNGIIVLLDAHHRTLKHHELRSLSHCWKEDHAGSGRHQAGILVYS